MTMIMWSAVVDVCRLQAYQMRPSIIFFDEIDGLAPVRSSRQDQIHRSEQTITVILVSCSLCQTCVDCEWIKTLTLLTES